MATAYPVSRRLWGLAAEVEATYGSAETVTFATNAMRLAERPTFSEAFLQDNERDAFFTGGLGELFADTPNGRFHEIDISMPIHGTGAAYASAIGSTPNIDPFLRAAGFAAAYTTGSVSYTVTDQPTEGLTVYTRFDGYEAQTTGAIVSEWEIVADAGGFPLFNAKLKGIGVTVAEVDIGSHTLPSTVPPKFANATLKIGAYLPVCRSFVLSGGLTDASRGDGRATGAHAGFRITRRKPTFSPICEAGDLTDFDPMADIRARTLRTLDMTIGAGGDHNTWGFDCDDSRVVSYTDSDEDCLALVEPEYRIFTPSAGAELTIKFT